MPYGQKHVYGILPSPFETMRRGDGATGDGATSDWCRVPFALCSMILRNEMEEDAEEGNSIVIRL